MTVIVKIGRRVPKSLRSRFVSKIQGLIGFQENIYVMMKMSFDVAKRKWKANPNQGNGKIDVFDIDKQVESEDEFYNLQWLVVTIKGEKDAEQDEFLGIQDMYSNLKKILSKKQTDKLPKDEKDGNVLRRLFKSKLVNEEKIKEAYDEGMKQNKEKSIANILLEMGIITHTEIIDDYEARVPTPDF